VLSVGQRDSITRSIAVRLRLIASASRLRQGTDLRAIPGAWPGKHPFSTMPTEEYSMNSHDDEKPQARACRPRRGGGHGFTGGGGPASVIYGDEDDDKVDEIAEEMLKAPDESD